MRLRPVDRDEAFAFVDKHHAHLGAPLSYIRANGVEVDGVLVCVSVLGRPVARLLQNGTTAEVTRVASDASTKHADRFGVSRATVARWESEGKLNRGESLALRALVAKKG